MDSAGCSKIIFHSALQNCELTLAVPSAKGAMPFDQAADAAADREIQASMYKKIHECRICGNTELIPLADLGEQYLTGVFPRQESGTTLTKGPLRLVKCHGGDDICGLLQLEHSYGLDEMHGANYGYRSGLNLSMVRHLHEKVARIRDMLDLVPGDMVVDIGSNDATTLDAYTDRGRSEGAGIVSGFSAGSALALPRLLPPQTASEGRSPGLSTAATRGRSSGVVRNDRDFA